VNQRTLAGSVRIEGRGLHTGEETRLVLLPAPAGHGRRFVRADVEGSPRFGVRDIDPDCEPGRTALARDGTSVQTIEHLLAALVGMGVDNVLVELHGAEPPAGDGSAARFSDAIVEAGVVEQDAPRDAYVIEEPILVEDGPPAAAREGPDSAAGPPGGRAPALQAGQAGVGPERDRAVLLALPWRAGGEAEGRLVLGYSLHCSDGPLANGWSELALTPDSFRGEVARARTFCMAEDVERLRAQGLGRGASHENTVVVDGDRAVGTELRFPDEPVRHKLLDLIGDLGLLDAPVEGRIVGFRSGHRLNRELVARVIRSCPRRRPGKAPAGPVISSREIAGVLPHRYPFLLVDRVLELEPEKRIAALKLVSSNEEFFLGHFPESPVMPGVLQVEALAQAAGLLLSKYVRVGGALAALVGLDRVKFRRPVVPGDRLILEVKVDKIRKKLAVTKGRATVGGEVSCEATMLFGLIGERSGGREP
jgi:UDP-3-O-[3-hydroxymyristoyl] N-acetylglucosamine deacetylase/3-hydroxyacyl-[acyl-carrier-protein] dehydratase